MDVSICIGTCQLGSGGAVILGRGAIRWHVRTQEVIASGTSGAAYVALVETVKHVVFLRQVQGIMLL